MSKFYEYPKWVKNSQGKSVIVEDEEQEQEITKKQVKKEENNGSNNYDSKRLNKKINDADSSPGVGRKSE